MNKINKYTLRFHSEIAWKFPYVVNTLLTKKYIWNKDFWGFQPKNDAKHLGFVSEELMDIAKDRMERL